VVGTLELDRTFEERETISHKVVTVLDQAATKWGIHILRFEIKNLVPPESVRQSMEKQVTAERNRRAIVERSVGAKQSLINTSEGQMTEMINRSEGEMQKRINEAQGMAQEIIAIGTATAESITKVARSLTSEGGKHAMKLELGQKYVNTLGQLQDGNRVILAGNLMNMNEMLKSMELDL
jgi:regulator of protease activity HflC (stomatin/prohibitin superfamily)